jgi:hypothetical protein
MNNPHHSPINTTPKKNGEPRQKLSCITVLIFVVISGGILFGLTVGLTAAFAPNLLNQMLSQLTGVKTIQTRPVEGDPANFDPILSFDSMQAFAGADAQLTEFEAHFVRSDGTLDLTATYVPSPRVKAEFMVKVDAPADAPPIGAGGGGIWYETITIDAYTPNQARRVTSSSLSYTYVNEGMTRSVRSPQTTTPTFLESPTCPFEALWRVALTEGAPSDAVAVITYDEDGYQFSIRDVGVSLQFTTDCEPR